MADWKTEDIDEKHQTEFATSLRIPFLKTWCPTWAYIVGIVVCDDIWPTAPVTDDEVKLLAEFLDSYNSYWYGPPGSMMRKRMAAFADYDIDIGANGMYFRKRSGVGWCYHKRTWDRGPIWMPIPEEGSKSLEDILQLAWSNWRQRKGF